MYKNASKGRALRQRVRSWDLFAPFFHLHDRQERPTLPLDHAELCAQTICENAGGNGAYQVLPGMIWDSAYPPSCRAPHEGVGQITPCSAAGAHLFAQFGMDPAYFRQERRGFSTFEFQFGLVGDFRAGDPVHVYTGLFHLGNASLRLHHRLSHGHSGQLIASLDQYGVHLNTDARRPVPLPSTLRQQAQRLVVPTQAGLQASSSVIAAETLHSPGPPPPPAWPA